MKKYIKDILDIFNDKPSDVLIILLFYNNGKMNNNLLKSSWIELHDNIKNYLIHRYTLFNTYQETIYRIKNNIEEIPKCLCIGCNNDVTFNIRYKGYTTHCSHKCAAIDKNVRLLACNTNILKYGVPYVSLDKNIYNKVITTNILKYGVPCTFLNLKVRDTYNNTIMEKYGVLWPAQNKDIYNKVINTKKINGTLTTSSIECLVYNYLISVYNKNDIKKLYKSELYPFFCDFYIVPILLYIEIQGHWSHGKHPYNENDIDDIHISNIWKEKSKESLYYLLALNTWTVKDVIKRNTAKNNNLNFLEIFSNNIDCCILYILEKIKQISQI